MEALWTRFVGFSRDSFFNLWKGIVEWLLFLYCQGLRFSPLSRFYCLLEK